jgi:hypothetical protein
VLKNSADVMHVGAIIVSAGSLAEWLAPGDSFGLASNAGFISYYLWDLRSADRENDGN